ncbi:hypothetical protein ACLB6G_20485 [Zhengella sp. ZM62]|uniref:hypothetical protein n=1 Tax=Zhengella sedimenti TaxID=3390035 RepID=UPI003974AB8F
MPVDPNTIAEIRHLHRQRQFAMVQRKRAHLSLGAFIRTNLGWTKDGDAKANAEIRKLTSDMIDGKADRQDFAEIIEAALMAVDPFVKIEADCQKAMTKLAKKLPVWNAWGYAINGFGPVGLAMIVGEAGDLSAYPKKGHLWKRMGLAVIDGTAQGRPGKGASASDWIARGYNPKRRSIIYQIGDSLIKKQSEYRDAYLERKAYERARAEMIGLQIVPAAKIPRKNADEFMSEGHVHNRAQRYMEKRLLRDLHKQWAIT